MKTEQKWAIGNGLELLDEQDKQSVTLVILDLPYYGVVSDEWDNQWKNLDDYLDWCKDWFVKSERCLKDNGGIYYFNSQYHVLNKIDDMVLNNTKLRHRQHITIDKGWQSACSYHGVHEGMRSYPVATEYLNWYTFQDTTGLSEIYGNRDCFLPIKDYLKNEKEKAGLSNKTLSLLFSEYYNKVGCLDRSVIEHYFQTSQWCFPTKEIYEQVLQSTGFFQKEYEALWQEYEALRYPFNYQNYSYDVWAFDFYKEKRYNHPTQKPFSLIERIVLTSSNEGDLVIDPAMGTGTTFKVCKAHNRNFKGRELNPDYEKDIISRAMVNTPRLDSWIPANEDA